MKLEIMLTEKEYKELTEYLREHDSFTLFKTLLIELKEAYKKNAQMPINGFYYALKCMEEDYSEMEEGEQKRALWEDIHSVKETIGRMEEENEKR